MAKFSIVTCGNYAREVKAALDEVSIRELSLVIMPTNCTRCLRNHQEAMAQFLDDHGLCEGDYWILGDAGEYSTGKGRHSLCHTALTNDSLISHWQKKGYYLVTPGWLMRWETLVYQEWGFDQQSAPAFLRESIHKIMLLDSGIYEHCLEPLEKFSELCQSTYEILPVGLSYVTRDVRRVFYAWKKRQAEQNLKAERQKSADYSLAFELIMEQSGIQDTAGVIKRTQDIGYLLTAAKSVRYIDVSTFDRDEVKPLFDPIHLDADINVSKKTFLEGTSSKDGRNFIIGLMFGELKLGYLLFENILFPERVKNYQQLFMNLAPVFAVNLMNAAHVEALEKEKGVVEKANQAKDVFLSVMSHEVRGPLNGVSGALQLIRLGGIRENQNELLSIAEDALASLLNSINTILDYTKVKSGAKVLELSTFALTTLITDVLSVFRGLSQLKNIALIERIDTTAQGLYVGDYGKLKQILLNLLGNALKFTEQGSIEIHVRQLRQTNQKELILEFTVLDSGIGIPPDKLETVFEAFEQGNAYTSSRYGGTGLGLAITKELVGILGGNVTAKNRETGGSALTFTTLLQRANQ